VRARHATREFQLCLLLANVFILRIVVISTFFTKLTSFLRHLNFSPHRPRSPSPLRRLYPVLTSSQCDIYTRGYRYFLSYASVQARFLLMTTEAIFYSRLRQEMYAARLCGHHSPRALLGFYRLRPTSVPTGSEEIIIEKRFLDISISGRVIIDKTPLPAITSGPRTTQVQLGLGIHVGAAPALLIQVSPGAHPPLFVSHSLISLHVGAAPSSFPQFQNSVSPQPPLLTAHSTILSMAPRKVVSVDK